MIAPSPDGRSGTLGRSGHGYPLRESELNVAGGQLRQPSSERSLAFGEPPLQFPTSAVIIVRALQHTFPYAVYSRASDEVVIVLGVLHLMRSPTAWRRRA